MARPRILIGEANISVQEALTKPLASKCEVVGTVSDVPTLLSAASHLQPEVIVLGGSLVGSGDLQAVTQEIRTQLPNTKVILITGEPSGADSSPAAKKGEVYVRNAAIIPDLARAVGDALRDTATRRPVQRAQTRTTRGGKSGQRQKLTSRQLEVLQLLAEGRTMRETATLLHVTPRTIAFHKYRIMKDCGLRTNSDLIRYAIREKLIS